MKGFLTIFVIFVFKIYSVQSLALDNHCVEGRHCQGSSEVQAAGHMAESFLLSPSLNGTHENIDSFSDSALVSREGEEDGQEPSLPLVGMKNKEISLFEAALEKEFLLRVNATFLHPVPQFNNGATRIVSFKKVGRRLFLLEATDGVLMTDEVPASLILAEFPVTGEVDGVITFDFNRGMSQFFFADSWHALDFGWESGMHFAAAGLKFSYVEEMTLLDPHRLLIRQVAQLAAGFERHPVEIRYLLEPYKANPDFKPTRTYPRDFSQVGFFTVEPRFTKGHFAPEYYATKFDLTKPLVFVISPNTPEKYRSAIKDGVLYWNQVLGEGAITVTDAPEGVSAPHPDYNVIQWMDTPMMGFAYADAQHDPRTGEVLNSQIWFSSIFAESPRLWARGILRQLGGGGGHSLENHSEEGDHQNDFFKTHFQKRFKSIAPKGFEKKPLCLYDFSEIKGVEEAVQAVDLSDDEKVLEIALDAVRHIMAHEVGHVLGLRHNFAGSLAVNYTKENRQGHFKEYLKSFKTPDSVIPGSSVMDYLSFIEEVFSGSQMREGQKKILSHDKLAIQYLYQKKSEEELGIAPANQHNRPLFCTDSHVSRYLDCNRFDVFNSPMEDSLSSFEGSGDWLVESLLRYFIVAKDPLPGRPVQPVSSVALYPEAAVSKIFEKQKLLLSLLSTKGSLLQIERSFEKVDGLNKERIARMTDEWIARELQRLGGVETVFGFLPKDFAEKENLKFSEYLKRHKEGMGYGGKGYRFTEEEQEYILKQVKSFFTLLQQKAPEHYLFHFTKMKELRDTEFTKDLAQFLLQKSRYYLMAVSPSMEEGSVKKGTTHLSLEIPSFLYGRKTRKLALAIFSRGRSLKNPYWGKLEKAQLKKDYASFLNDALGGQSFLKLKEASLSPNLLPWYWEQREILNFLSW